MHTPEEQTRRGDIVHQAEQVAHAAADGADFAEGPFTISICDVDLPAFIWNEVVYVQVPLQGFFDAVAAAISHGLSDLEARISEAGRTALSSADFRRELSRSPVVGQGVVRDSGEW